MAGLTETPILTKTVKAAAATEANRFVEHDGSAPTAGGSTYGVTRAKAKANERVAVTVLGTAIVATSAAAVAVGDKLEALANGTVKKHDGAGVTVGRALTAVPAAGGDIEALLIPN